MFRIQKADKNPSFESCVKKSRLGQEQCKVSWRFFLIQCLGSSKKISVSWDWPLYTALFFRGHWTTTRHTSSSQISKGNGRWEEKLELQCGTLICNMMWMRSSRVVRASHCLCRSRNSPGFYPSILRHSGIWGAADAAVLKTVQSAVQYST